MRKTSRGSLDAARDGSCNGEDKKGVSSRNQLHPPATAGGTEKNVSSFELKDTRQSVKLTATTNAVRALFENRKDRGPDRQVSRTKIKTMNLKRGWPSATSMAVRSFDSIRDDEGPS
jgi:hypothetical protein